MFVCVCVILLAGAGCGGVEGRGPSGALQWHTQAGTSVHALPEHAGWGDGLHQSISESSVYVAACDALTRQPRDFCRPGTTQASSQTSRSPCHHHCSVTVVDRRCPHTVQQQHTAAFRPPAFCHAADRPPTPLSVPPPSGKKILLLLPCAAAQRWRSGCAALRPSRIPPAPQQVAPRASLPPPRGGNAACSGGGAPPAAAARPSCPKQLPPPQPPPPRSRAQGARLPPSAGACRSSNPMPTASSSWTPTCRAQTSTMSGAAGSRVGGPPPGTSDTCFHLRVLFFPDCAEKRGKGLVQPQCRGVSLLAHIAVGGHCGPKRAPGVLGRAAQAPQQHSTRALPSWGCSFSCVQPVPCWWWAPRGATATTLRFFVVCGRVSTMLHARAAAAGRVSQRPRHRRDRAPRGADGCRACARPHLPIPTTSPDARPPRPLLSLTRAPHPSNMAGTPARPARPSRAPPSGASALRSLASTPQRWTGTTTRWSRWRR